IAFGIQIPYAILLPLIVVLIIVGLILASNHLNLKNTYAQIAVGAVFGGAVSNLIDRMMHGHVVDFIKIWIWPVFNLADAFITIGIFSVIIFYDRISKTNKHSK
ncbi:signal peptidase II, partial [Patescibacteria group bacterium]|nr:signal peptidase II [Patescibacteria group bacterium]